MLNILMNLTRLDRLNKLKTVIICWVPLVHSSSQVISNFDHLVLMADDAIETDLVFVGFENFDDIDGLLILNLLLSVGLSKLLQI